MATETQIEQIYHLLAVHHTYYAKSLAPGVLEQQLDLWKLLLADVPGEQLRAAALQHMASNKEFFPNAGQLRTAALTLAAPRNLTAMEGWGEVLDAMKDPAFYIYPDGPHHLPTFSPVTQRVVDAMGWRNLCLSEDTTADRARFLQAFDAIAARTADERLTLPVVAELSARLRALPQVKRIGA